MTLHTDNAQGEEKLTAIGYYGSVIEHECVISFNGCIC